MAAIRHLKVVGLANVKRTVAMPVCKPNAAYRSREHLTEREIERLVEAAKDNRWGHRDATMVLLAFRHGLRASELVDLRREQVDLENAILHVRRVKQGTPACRQTVAVRRKPRGRYTIRQRSRVLQKWPTRPPI
jgi:integrase